MKDCKLIASDLDGTLLRHDMTLSAENAKAIEEFNKLGIIFMASSGRTLHEIPECIRENPNIRYLTYSNGAAVYDKEKGCNILSHEISKENVAKTLDILSAYDVLCVAHLNGKAYHAKDKTSDEILKYYQMNDYYRDIILSGEEADDIEKTVRDAEKVESFAMFFHSDKDIDEVSRRLADEVEAITVTSSTAHQLEICSADAGKGAMLSELSDMLGISGEKIIAIGDNLNDTSMFPYAALALCVSNGSCEARELADEIVCSNEEHVADYVLKRHIEAQAQAAEKKTLKSKILTVAASAAILLALILSAVFFGERSSAVKVGYMGHSTASSWSATYAKLDGKLQRTVRTKNDTLKLSIKTSSGSISVQIVDSEDNVLFEKDGIGTEAFEIEIDGRVTVIIEADDHSGSFVIG